MKRIFILPSFERSVKKLAVSEKKKLQEGLSSFNDYLVTGRASRGFRLKKICQDKYEFRVDIKLRVIFKGTEGDYYLILAGNHDDIIRYLRK